MFFAWFLRKSYISATLMYWQLIRIKYMLGGRTADAFKVIDRKANAISQTCPVAMIKSGHQKVRDILIKMGDLD